MIEGILIATAVVGGISLLIGLLLGLAGRAFAVEVDEREAFVREVLPGNNCGGCGYAGCDGLAAAIIKGEASVGACPVGGNEVMEKIAAIMGAEHENVVRQVAFVHCAGTCDKKKRVYDYYGAPDCRQAAMAPGYAGGACAYACFGLGTCAKACPTGAIRVKDGVAVVDPEVCIHCGVCVASCPQHIISMRPYDAVVEVACSSHAVGKAVKAVCDAGCIGCGLCQKVCPSDAIHVVDHLAVVDQEQCTGCGACAAKCPVDIIKLLKK